MFYIISKIIAFVSNPLFWICSLFLTYLILKKSLQKKIFLTLSVVTLLFFTNGFFAEKILKHWEYPLIPVLELKHHRVGIVLGGTLRMDKRDTSRVFISAAGDRIIQAIELYKMGKIDKILFTGGAGNIIGDKRPESVQVKKLVQLMGVPDDAMIYEERSKNTYENAKFSAAIIKEKFPADDLLLITSTAHMRRGVACFFKQGINVTPFPVDQFVSDEVRSIEQYLFPRLEIMLYWEIFLHELIGYVSYKAMGYI